VRATEIIAKIEQLGGRIRIWVFIIGGLAAVVPAIVSYFGISFGAAPLYLLIPAMLTAGAATIFILQQARRPFVIGDSVPSGTPEPLPQPEPRAIGDIAAYIDFRDALGKISLTPKLNLVRLRIRLEWSHLSSANVGTWTNPIAREIADFRDLLNGVRQTITLTDPHEIHPVPKAPQRLINWTKTETPITKGLYRVRLTFIGEGVADIVSTFFLVAYLDENKNMAVEIIG
jgi:hypothetical protein